MTKSWDVIRSSEDCYDTYLTKFKQTQVTSLINEVIAFVYMKFPKLNAEDSMKVKLPRSIEDAKVLGKLLSNYTDEYFIEVIVAFTLTYIFLQSFAIPGSIFLSILSGFLFPFPLALFLVCFCSLFYTIFHVSFFDWWLYVALNSVLLHSIVPLSTFSFLLS